MKKLFSAPVFTLSLVAFLLPLIASAAPYIPLEPLPFISGNNGTNLPAFLQALFQLLLIGGAGLAVLMITIGGIQYMTGDALHQKAEGRTRLTNAILGLILLLFIYLLLRTVNPQLLNFDLASVKQVGQRSAQIVAQQQQSQQQRESGAATAGPASNTAGASTGSGSRSAASSPQCLPGDFCNGNGGFNAMEIYSSSSNYASTPGYNFSYTLSSGETINRNTSSESACASAQQNVRDRGGATVGPCAQSSNY